MTELFSNYHQWGWNQVQSTHLKDDGLGQISEKNGLRFLERTKDLRKLVRDSGGRTFFQSVGSQVHVKKLWNFF